MIAARISAAVRSGSSRSTLIPMAASLPSTRLFHTSSLRLQEDPRQMRQPLPENQPEPPKYSVKNYRGLELPWLRVFLAAMLTYQLCYWSWEKMRTDEIVAEKTAEIEGLETQIGEYQQQPKSR